MNLFKDMKQSWDVPGKDLRKLWQNENVEAKLAEEVWEVANVTV